MVLKMKNFNILGVHLKIWLLGGGFIKKQYRVGDCLKMGGLGQFANLRVGLGKKEGGGCFWGGGDTPMHTMGSM